MVRLGVESLVERRASSIAGERVGLITNPSGVDRDLTPTIDLLYDHPNLDLRTLFAPEHGIRGNVQADVTVEESVDEHTGLPVRSLYGEHKTRLDEMIADLDVLVYDMQDVGCRFYTLIYTLAHALRGVASAGKRLVVLDRPNPVAPVSPTGNTATGGTSSVAGDNGLPVVHGMTVGELAHYFNHQFGIDADLEVVEIEGWDRSTWFDETDLPWVLPSPNMPTLTTATVYPGTGFFEGTNLSEGRGTTRPFELIGAPWIDGEEWAAHLNEQGLPGVGFRPAYFTPMFSKHERKDIEGVQVHVLDRDVIDPVAVGVTMLITAFNGYSESEWLRHDGGYFIDELASGSYLRKAIDGADPSVEPIEMYNGISEYWEDDIASFAAARERHALYPAN
ncbi:exo-beta-N-acetylmuramidase NamZ domain-containing protein [Halobacteriaceae archaeon GCM10025711]